MSNIFGNLAARYIADMCICIIYIYIANRSRDNCDRLASFTIRARVFNAVWLMETGLPRATAAYQRQLYPLHTLYRLRHIDRSVLALGSTRLASNTNTILEHVTRTNPRNTINIDHRYRQPTPTSTATLLSTTTTTTTIPWLPHWIALYRCHYHNSRIFHGRSAKHGLWLIARLLAVRHTSIDRWTRPADGIFEFSSSHP